MARKIKTFDYNDTFPRRFRELLESREDITQEAIAELVGVTRQTVGNWYSGKSAPDAVSLAKIADEFHVSIDWLLRENAPKQIDAELSAVCEYTGLSEIAIKSLHNDFGKSGRILRTTKKRAELVSSLFCSISIGKAHDFLFWAEEAIKQYAGAVSSLEIENDNINDASEHILSGKTAEDAYREYKVAIFWCQQAITDWLKDEALEKAGGANYELLREKYDRALIDIILNTEHIQEGESDGEHTKEDN